MSLISILWSPFWLFVCSHLRTLFCLLALRTHFPFLSNYVISERIRHFLYLDLGDPMTPSIIILSGIFLFFFKNKTLIILFTPMDNLGMAFGSLARYMYIIIYTHVALEFAESEEERFLRNPEHILIQCFCIFILHFHFAHIYLSVYEHTNRRNWYELISAFVRIQSYVSHFFLASDLLKCDFRCHLRDPISYIDCQ